jgi:hypothetical protein
MAEATPETTTIEVEEDESEIVLPDEPPPPLKIRKTKSDTATHPRALAKWEELQRRGLIKTTEKKSTS